MKTMKKVEVVIEAVYLNRLLELYAKNGIDRYTVFKDIEGSGGHGLKMADDVTDVFSNDYVLSVCDEEKFLEIKEQIRSFIKKYGGKCFVTDTMMLL
jgi:nitrogen regulatory protein PII